jgi:AbiJ N-terminal domain 4
MSIIDIFSKRQKRLRGDEPDVFKYDEIPPQLRVQIIHIWDEALGGPRELASSQNPRLTYQIIAESLCREYGVFYLGSDSYAGHRDQLCNLLLQEADVSHVLDAVELSFRCIDRSTREFDYLFRNNADRLATEAIDELNLRFREHGVGFAYESGEIIRVDSQLIHAEVVKPALRLLVGKKFAGAQEEFLQAHDHYRKGRHKEALVSALKSFESVLKVVCDKKRWPYEKNATAKDLIAVCFQKGLVPSFWESAFGNLRSLLESGVPTARNRLGGHGQGSEPVDVPEHVVAFVLHMTAAAIMFLAQASDAKT